MLWACSIVSAIHDAATESEQVSVFPHSACTPQLDATVNKTNIMFAHVLVNACDQQSETNIMLSGEKILQDFNKI